MNFATLVIGDWNWMLPAGGFALAGAVLLWLVYRRLNVTRTIRWSAAGLKATGIALLAICLVDPLWSGTRARPGANIFLIVADNSQSLRIRDPGSSTSRGDRLKDVLQSEKAAWRVRLNQDFDVRRYLVDSRLRRTDDFSQLDFKGTATSLATTLKTLRERFQDRPLAGILLLTDGNATDLNTEPLETTGWPPIYPVLLGSDATVKDVSIHNVAVSQTAFEDAPVTIRADVAASGYTGNDIVARLFDSQDELLDEQVLSAGEDGKLLAFRFQLRPKKQGISFYRLRVAEKDEWRAFEHPESSSEATLENNSQLIKVDRGEGRSRILYLSGRPNWEFKFLRRAIETDDQLDLVGLIRVAKREAKFDFRGRAGESSNPLFSGFKKKSDEETERYDQPVLVRLNTKDSQELRGGFPKTEQELYPFRAVIIDDLEAEFFTHDQLALLQRFVSERGGGLLMLGGVDSFFRGGYRRTPVGDLLPVYLDRTSSGGSQKEHHLTLTREGWLQPWIRLRPNELEERERLDKMPGFRTLNKIGSVKPGASVLALAGDNNGKQHPALVVHRFGRGRCAAMLIGDLWRWQLRREDDSDDLGKAWRQMLRWLVADVPNRIDVQVAAQPNVSADAIRLQVRVRDKDYNHLDNAAVRITVNPPDGKPAHLEAEPSLDEAGLYEAVYVPRAPGGYRAEVTVADGDGEEVGTANTGWTADAAREEFYSIKPNRVLMQELATQTGGEIVAADGLEKFVKSLSTRKVPVTEQWTFPLWHQSWVFLLAVGCLVGEWGLRRLKGLP